MAVHYVRVDVIAQESEGSMPNCFVIMPYGGADERATKYFAGIYQSIFVPAATRAGLAVKRSDIAGEPGNITHDIIRDLSEADVVIADLTGGNANVFFELGIRHVFRKSGTVHVIDKSHPLPFDVRQYRAISYSTDLSELPDVIDAIVEAILKRIQQPGKADNPVHDALPALPLNLRSIGEDAWNLQIQQLQGQAEALQDDKKHLEERLLQLDPTWSTARIQQQVDVDSILDEADEIMKSTGEHVLLRLTAAAESGGKDGFAKALRSVLKSPYLENNDFVQIAAMCRSFDLGDHRRAVYEVATRRFPGEEDFILSLADCYDDSPSQGVKERGRLLVEQYLGVVHGPEGPVVTAPLSNAKAIPAAGLLCNAYFQMGRPSWVLSLTDSAENVLGPHSLLVRNRARALADLNRASEAEKEHKRAIEIDPHDDTAHAFYSNFLDDQQRYDESYEEHEKAIYADPDDGSRFSNLGIQILNRGLVRDGAGHLIGPVARKERVRFALPFFVRALEDPRRRESLRGRIIGILVRADALSEAKAIQAGSSPTGQFDDAGLRYVENCIAVSTQGS
jgi:tetratricopeptide (TPR) repeat protein